MQNLLRYGSKAVLPQPHHGNRMSAYSCFSNAACCKVSVVDTAGHPFPDPLRFCSVTSAESTRASCDPTELSSGKDTLTVGLFTAWPARTSARRCYNARIKVGRCHFLMGLFQVLRLPG